MDRGNSVLWLGNDEAVSGALRELLAKHVIVKSVRDIPGALSVLEDGDYIALFCAWTSHFGTWREAVREVLKRFPELPIIVVYHAADEKAWVDVLNAGAFDLLAPPYSERMVLALLEQAVLSREVEAAA